MTVPIATLRAAAARPQFSMMAKSAALAQADNRKAAFLCHSHQDQELAKGLEVFLREQGWDVYIDWADTSMPAQPNHETAIRIQAQIEQRYWFLVLATPNSVASRWCPWEIGYADKAKGPSRVIVIPTNDAYGNVTGNEYLQLYRHVFVTKNGHFALFEAGQNNGTPLAGLS